MFIPKFLVVFLALLLGSVVAAPTYYERSDEVALEARQRGIGQFKQAAQAVSTINQVKKAFRPKSGEAVFWSGTRKDAHGHPVSVHGDAQKFAHAHDKSTINHGLAQHGIKIPERHENKYSDHIWNVASKVWAERAHGDTHAVLGGTVRPGSVYNTIEKPILMKNERVTKLTEHNMETGKSTVVK
ncbi:hypothetical protein BJ912DRAFT_902216 [Pholiota molesta]|nr:hypothetical protein BJ912DRAFT_915724 [Pholiota molesta]KAF8192061.1 hypothetical protein BJ912DRAFT_902216 [Pholiota molesta]